METYHNAQCKLPSRSYILLITTALRTPLHLLMTLVSYPQADTPADYTSFCYPHTVTPAD